MVAQGIYALLLYSEMTKAQQMTDTVATSSVGKVGQRQTRNQPTVSTPATGRINNRVQNRIQLRTRNRLNRFYSPQSQTASPFDVANQQSRN